MISIISAIIGIDFTKLFHLDGPTIHFNQSDLTLDPNKHQAVIEIVKEYGGLCDLICNRILIDDLLGSEDLSALKNRVTVEKLNEDAQKNRHVLKVYSLYLKIISTFLGIYPDNILPFNEQWSLVDKSRVNPEILAKALDQIHIGETLKLEVFNRNNILQIWDRKLLEIGHSMLIKKTSPNEYIFFDPNQGEYRQMSLGRVIDKINRALRGFNCSDACLINGKAFLEKLSMQKAAECPSQYEVLANYIR